MVTITRTNGVTEVAGVAEVATASFTALISNQTIIFAGVTVTANASGATATEVATVFASLAAGATPNSTANLTVIGSLLPQYSTSAASGSNVVFTATTQDNLTDLVSAGTGVVTVTITTQGVTPVTAVTETTDVGFVDLAVGEQLTIGGLTATAIAPVTAANVAAAFANTTTGHATAALAFSGTLTGFTASAVSNVNHVIFTSTTPNSNVADLVVNYSPTAETKVFNGVEDAPLIPIDLVATDKDGSVTSFKVISLPSNGTLYANSNLTQPLVANSNVNLPISQISSLTTDQIAALTPVEIQALTTIDIMAMTTAQVASLNAAQVPLIGTTQISVMSVDQVAVLLTAGIQAMTNQQLDVLSPDQVAALATAHPSFPTLADLFPTPDRYNLLYNAWTPVILPTTAQVYFKPNANWNGTTTFDYVAVDGNNAESASATATVNVAPLPDAPTFTSRYVDSVVITQGSGTTPESAAVTFAALNKGDSFTFNGVSVFAANNATGADVATAFANHGSNTPFNNESFGNLVLNGAIGFQYHTDAATGSTVTFTNSAYGDIPDWELTPTNTGISVAEETTISSTGSFAISDVDFADLPDGDTVSVDILGVTVNSSNSLNDGTLAALLTSNLPQVLNFLELSPATLTANSNVNWSFNIANIPAFANLLTGESIHLSYQIEATDSNNLINTPPQTLNFTIQGQTQIISAVVIPADPDVPATIKIETENGTAIRLFEGITDVTDKFNQDFVVDTFSGIKTVTFTVKPNSGYNGDRNLVAKSFLIGDPNTVQSTSANLSLTLPDGDDNLVGTAGNDILFGGAGNDTLFGLDGNDSLDGGSGNDSLDGGFGNDSLDGGVGTDTLSGEAGDDEYFIHDAEDVIIEATGQGIDTIHLTTSYNLLAIAQGGNYELPEIENIYLDGTANINASGNHGANAIYGNSGNNTLNDGNASDSTTPDTLSGGKGDDVYVIHNNATIVVGETNIGGVDTIQYWVNGLCVLPKNVENLILFGTYGSTPSCGGKGNNLANSITGSAGTDTLDGGAGADTLTGGAGDDTYIIDRATDIITENTDSGTDTVQSIVTYTLPTNVENLTLTGLAEISGTGNELNNTITGNNAANTLIGGLGADFLTGISGNDSLDGGAGSDTLIGGMGVDTLTGGTEADTFTFLTISEMGIATRRDVITDFTTGTDKIDLSAMNIVGSAGTGALVDMFKIRWTFYGGYAVVQGDTNEDPATIEFEIKLNGVTALADTDFIFAFGAPIHYGTIAAFLLDASSIPAGNSVTVDATGATQTQLDDLISYISKIAVDGITGTGLSVTDTQFAAIAPKLATSVNDVTVNAAAATSSELQALSINIDRVGSITNLTIDAASQTDTETANLLSKAASSVSIIATGATQTEVVSMTINASKIADSGITGSINLTAAQSQVLAANLATSATVTVTDTGVNIAASIANLVVNIVKIDNIDAIDNSLTLNTAQFNAIGDARLTTSDVITVSDSIANINTNLNTLVDSLKVDNIITSLVTIGETLNVLPADGTTVGSYSTTASANTAAVVTAGEWYFDSVTDVLTFWDATGASAKSITLTGANSIAADNSGVFTIS